MKRLIEKITGGYSSSAKVVDGTLVLSLPDALSPIVWRMELGHVKASALEVRDADNDTFVLTLKTPREDVHDIAPFATRAAAIKALMAVSHALEQQHYTAPAAAAAAANDTNETAAPTPQSLGKATGKKSKALTGLIALLILGGLIMLLMNMTPKSASFPGVSDQTASFAGNPAATTGVPVSADDFLRAR